ncbi:MAG: type 4a pilus biogenesis protein PilO [Candidatus Eisenbacteria bacterium]
MAINARDPRVQKSILGAMLVGAVVYVYFFTDWFAFTYKANASELSELEEEYRELSKDLNKARQAINRLPYLEKEYELLHEKWEQGRQLLPEEEEMVEMLQKITLLGTRAGVEFTLFKPLPPRPMQDYTEIPMEITVAGGYHQVGAFLSEVANMKRIVNVSGLEMKTVEERSAREGQTATATFEAVAYRLGGTGVPDAEGQADAGAAAGARAKNTKKKASASARSGGKSSGGSGE